MHFLGIGDPPNLKAAPLFASDLTIVERDGHGGLTNLSGCFSPFLLGSNDLCDSGPLLWRDHPLSNLYRPLAAYNSGEDSSSGPVANACVGYYLLPDLENPGSRAW